MTDIPSKAPRSAYKPRSQAWVGKGSHQTSQRVVGRSSGSVQLTKRTYGFCTSLPCLPAGRSYMRVRVRVCARAMRAGAPAREAPLAPPRLALVGGAHPQFFPTFLTHGLLSDNQPKGVFDGL